MGLRIIPYPKRRTVLLQCVGKYLARSLHIFYRHIATGRHPVIPSGITADVSMVVTCPHNFECLTVILGLIQHLVQASLKNCPVCRHVWCLAHRLKNEAISQLLTESWRASCSTNRPAGTGCPVGRSKFLLRPWRASRFALLNRRCVANLRYH